MKNLIFMILFFLLAIQLIFGQTDVQSENPTDVYSFKSRLINISELNAGFGLGETNIDYAKQFFGLTSVLGYGITKNLQTGIGTGFLIYNGGMLVPFYLDLRFLINFGRMSAYAFGDGGMLFNFSNPDLGNKYLLNPGIGVKYSIGKNLSVNLGGGLFLQTTKDREQDSFFNLKLGITYAFRKKDHVDN